MSSDPKGSSAEVSAAAGRGGVGTILKALVALLVLALAMGSSLAAVLVHGHPWGLALAWVAGAAALWALPGTWWGRPIFAFGWLVVLVVVLFPRPEGDFLIADNPSGYLLLASGIVFPVAAMFGVRPGRRSRPAAR